MDPAIVAACLPTYAALLQNRTHQSIVRSARSAISLRSRESENRSRREDEESSEAKRAWLVMQDNNGHDALINHSSIAEASTDGADTIEDTEVGIRVHQKFGRCWNLRGFAEHQT